MRLLHWLLGQGKAGLAEGEDVEEGGVQLRDQAPQRTTLLRLALFRNALLQKPSPLSLPQVGSGNPSNKPMQSVALTPLQGCLKLCAAILNLCPAIFCALQ
jgi:hypothetical protein